MLEKYSSKPILMSSLGAVFMVFVWSGWIILSRAGVQSNLSPSDLTIIRYGTATLFALPFSLRYDWKKVTLWKAIVVSLGCGFPYTMFSFYGLISIKAANAGVIVNGLLPVFGVLMAFLVLGERTTKLRLVAIGLILIANLVMMGNPFQTQSNWFGWLMLIGASIVFSSYMFLGKRYAYTSRDVLAFLPLINAILFLPIWLMTDSGMPATPWSTLLLQASYQGILVSIVTLLITFYAIKHIGAMNLSIYFSFVPFVTAVLAWPILNERLSTYEIVGILICSTGLLLYAKKPIVQPILKS